MTFTVRALMHPHQNLYAASKIYSGLMRLRTQGCVRLSFVADSSPRLDPVIPIFQITGDTGVKRAMAIDLYDRGDRFCLKTLETCDIYFKRGYRAVDVATLPELLRGKVARMGANFACQAPGLRFAAMSALGFGYATRLARAFIFDKAAYADDRHILTQFLTLPMVDVFEADPAEELKPVVLLQTRVWEPEDTTDGDVQGVNDGRATLVRSLRKAFGDRFLGGIVPTPFAKAHYPDVITPFSSRRAEYIAMSRSAPIAIYCRGLHHSTAFKLGEYLAGSKAIIIEPLGQELRLPLKDGVNCLPFGSPEECVEHCGKLLNDKAMLAAMRQENYRYYRDQIEPSADVLKCLEQACAVG